MKPAGMLFIIFFLMVSIVAVCLVVCYSDKIVAVFEGVSDDSYRGDSYIVIGTPDIVLSLQKSDRGEIKQCDVFVRGKADDFLPANFVGVGEE